MSLTTQSESVPLVEATTLAMGWPLIFSGAVSISETKTTTSARPETSRWSSTSQLCQGTLLANPTGWLGRARKGTGLAGSETYSSNGASLAAGAVKVSFSPALRYSGVGFTLQPLAHPDGHAGNLRQVFVPVSNAVTGATSLFGAPSFRYCARNGARISLRKYSPVSLPNFSAPSELPSSISCP